MKIISFAWTTPALLARAKTVTRRDWVDKYARSFHEGELVQAWDASPRYFGKKVGIIELTNKPYQEWSANVQDWAAEGFEYLIKNIKDGINPFDIIRDWKDNPRNLWVIRFRLVEVVEKMDKVGVNPFSELKGEFHGSLN